MLHLPSPAAWCHPTTSLILSLAPSCRGQHTRFTVRHATHRLRGHMWSESESDAPTGRPRRRRRPCRASIRPSVRRISERSHRPPPATARNRILLYCKDRPDPSIEWSTCVLAACDKTRPGPGVVQTCNVHTPIIRRFRPLLFPAGPLMKNVESRTPCMQLVMLFWTFFKIHANFSTLTNLQTCRLINLLIIS